jgi:hypothetical protein
MPHKKFYKYRFFSDFMEKNGVFGDFSVNKYEKLLVYGDVCMYAGLLGGSYDSQATNRTALESGEFSH